MTETQPEIRILAQPSATGDSCSFVMYPPLYDGVNASFVTAEEAQGSPLPQRLFALDGVARVVINPNRLTLFRGDDSIDWSVLGKQVGATIREHHAAGEPVVSESVASEMAENSSLADKVQSVLDTDINPSVASHGGFISLLGVKNNNVYIQMGGGCQGCAQSSATLRQGVETAIRRAVPEVVEIFDTTDHASGTNPYYRS